MASATRRVVTGVDDDGTSHVVEDGPAPVEGGFVQLWSTDGPLQQPGIDRDGFHTTATADSRRV